MSLSGIPYKNDAMRTIFTLDGKGVALALVMGIAVLALGGASAGPFFLLVLLSFLIIAYLATEAGRQTKIKIRTYEQSRGWKNVAANGLVPVVIALLYCADVRYAFIPLPALILAYVGSIAAVAADKFSSELGVLGGRPFMLLTMERVDRGVSGAVSPLGFAAGIFGAAIIGSVVFFYRGSALMVAIVLAAGFAGDIVDSLLGYFEWKGLGNKYTSNIGCAVAGGIVGMLLFLVFVGVI